MNIPNSDMKWRASHTRYPKAIENVKNERGAVCINRKELDVPGHGGGIRLKYYSKVMDALVPQQIRPPDAKGGDAFLSHCKSWVP